MRISRRRILALAILGTWLAVVGVHVRREYFRPFELVLAEGAAGLAPGSTFYLARMGDHAIGVATARLDTLEDGFLVEDFLTLDVPALGTVHRAVARTTVKLSKSLGLVDFNFDLDSEVGRFAVRGVARGDTLLELEIGAGGERQRTSIATEGAIVLPSMLPIRLAAAGRLAVGERMRARLFDPSTLAPRDVELRITAHDTMLVADTAVWNADTGEWVGVPDTIPAWRIEETFAGISVASWVDEDGRLIRAESPLGFTLERTAYEIAQQEWRRSLGDGSLALGYGTVIEGTAIAANAPLGATGSIDRLAVRLVGVELDGFDLSGGRQELRGDTLFITREVLAGGAGYELPYRGGGSVAEELASTPLIQADDPRIARTARQIVGDERDAATVARLLNDWVYANVRKDVTLSVPSALQVLEAMTGDCNEHTVLYVALARSLGLPTRTAVGLVHIDGRFYYHAWPEVWLDDRWVAVDPTLGQFPADASHLRFLVGGLARQVELVRLIGRLRLEPVM